jgi:hypothetical protein
MKLQMNTRHTDSPPPRRVPRTALTVNWTNPVATLLRTNGTCGEPENWALKSIMYVWVALNSGTTSSVNALPTGSQRARLMANRYRVVPPLPHAWVCIVVVPAGRTNLNVRGPLSGVTSKYTCRRKGGAFPCYLGRLFMGC